MILAADLTDHLTYMHTFLYTKQVFRRWVKKIKHLRWYQDWPFKKTR